VADVGIGEVTVKNSSEAVAFTRRPRKKIKGKVLYQLK
jgi:hypothetical protein